MSGFQSRPDGEYFQCQSCVRKGYGPDAWLPCTFEYWPHRNEGSTKLSFATCKACKSEIRTRCKGVIREAA